MPKPHGGKLVTREFKGNAEELRGLEKIEVTLDTARDIWNIAYGVFSPLEGFMCENDFRSVIENMRLENDVPWTLPVLIDSDRKVDGDVLLTYNDTKIALMEIEDIYEYDKREYAEKVFGTHDKNHPGVYGVYKKKNYLLGGKISLLNEVKSQFENYKLKPIETRVLFKEKNWRTVVGFQTRNVPHVGHEYVQKTALTFLDGIFINPIIGRKKKGDFKDEVILKSYQSLIDNYYLKDRAVMSILETEMRYAGPREAVFHSIVRKNFGCTHFIVGRDHAGVGNYYPPYAAQEIFDEFPDLGIVPLFFKTFFYCTKCNAPVNEKICPHSDEYRISFSGTKIRKIIQSGWKPDKILMREEVADIILGYENPFVE